MSLVLEDGTGVVTANAYATVAEIAAILSSNIHSTWMAMDQDSQEKLVIWATRVLDERVKWFGQKSHQTSGLAWPRAGTKDKEGYPIDDNLVPRQVKVAVAVLAEHLVAGNPDVVDTTANKKMVKVDVVELEFDPRITNRKWPAEVDLIIEGLGYGTFGRGGPKRIIKH
jgi:hypothetical protein